MTSSFRSVWSAILSLALVIVAPICVHAEIPAAETLLADLGFSAAEISEIESGKIVPRSVTPAHERDLATSFAFFVPVAPAALIEDLRAGLLSKVDANTIGRGVVSGSGSVDQFAGLKLTPDGPARARRYVSKSAADELNLSAEEQAAFGRLSPSASVAEVEAQVRASLAARHQAYHTRGLAGIAPYVRGEGAARAVADDLRVALESLKNVEKYAPGAYAAMAGYPRSLPAGTVDGYTWAQLMAHGAPTIVLTHALIVPDGDAYLAMQRQFYVSEGFNGEQAVAGILPAKGGTIVLYVNHTSTDQVAGFGGGAKRSIGSKLMASELEGIFTRVQKTAH